VTAEYDIVTVIHTQYRQDPTAAPGTLYQLTPSFDAFRVKNGKLVEHWQRHIRTGHHPGDSGR
jgi:predicted SnoaL-like aldol condensation-catalyzing enzyme